MSTNDINKELKKVVAGLKDYDLTPVLAKSAAIFRASIDRNFSRGGRWDGVGTTIFSGGSSTWKPLAESTKKAYKKKGYDLTATLRRTNSMRSTIEIRPSGQSTIYITANSPYAQIHQFGGIIKHPGGTPYISVGAGVARFISKKAAEKKHGVKYTKPHNITIPARPFLTIGEPELKQILTLVGSVVV